MGKSKIGLISFFIIASSVSVAFGFVMGSSNLIRGYPSFSSYKPVKPFTKEKYFLNNYKWEVERYVEESKNYVEAANNDIQRIQKEKNNAINDANNVVDEYNNFVKYEY